MGQINTNNYPTVNSLSDADLLIVENATHGTGTTTPKQLRENAIGTGTLQTSAQTVTGAINELKHEIDLGAGVARYDVDTITSGYLGQFSGSANLLLLHLTTDGIADATNGYMMMLSYSRPVARFAYGRLVDSDGVAYKQDVYADNTIICTISGSGEGTESDPVQVVILGIINTGFMLTPTAVVSDRDIIDGQGNTLSVLAEALTKTASGNPVVISDCAGGKARSLITEINAIQDLHGYDKPWVGGAGKNKLPMTVDEIKSVNTSGTWNGNTYTHVNGVKVTILTDDDNNVIGFELNETTNGTFEFRFSSTNVSLPSGNYIWSIQNTINLDGLWVSIYNPNTVAIITKTATSSNYTCNGTFGGGYIFSNSGNTFNNIVIKPMLRLATESDPTFEPYSNICPISGRTAVAISRYSNNLVNADELEDDKYLDGTGTAVYNVDCYVTGFIPLKSGQPIYIPATGTARRCTYYADKSFKEYLNVSAAQVLTPNFDGYLRVSVRYDTIAKNDLQINYGSAAIPFEPQGIDTAIQLGQTVYGADINWDTGVGTIEWLAHIFTGEETIEISNDRFSYAQDGAAPQDDNYNCISSHYKKETNTNIYNNRNTAGYTGICAYASRIMWVDNVNFASKDVTAYKTYLASQYAAGTPFIITYKLATPIELTLTPTQLQMLKGYNRVTIESGSIELGYIAKLT